MMKGSLMTRKQQLIHTLLVALLMGIGAAQNPETTIRLGPLQQPINEPFTTLEAASCVTAGKHAFGVDTWDLHESWLRSGGRWGDGLLSCHELLNENTNWLDALRHLPSFAVLSEEDDWSAIVWRNPAVETAVVRGYILPAPHDHLLILSVDAPAPHEAKLLEPYLDRVFYAALDKVFASGETNVSRDCRNNYSLVQEKPPVSLTQCQLNVFKSAEEGWVTLTIDVTTGNNLTFTYP